MRHTGKHVDIAEGGEYRLVVSVENTHTEATGAEVFTHAPYEVHIISKVIAEYLCD